jgi:hypothetical protein
VKVALTGECHHHNPGGVGGLVNMVLEESVLGIGMRAAYAEGNALGKGPVVLHIPR